MALCALVQNIQKRTTEKVPDIHHEGKKTVAVETASVLLTGALQTKRKKHLNFPLSSIFSALLFPLSLPLYLLN